MLINGLLLCMVLDWASALPNPDTNIWINIHVDGDDTASSNAQESSETVKCGIENSATQRIINGVDVSFPRKYSWHVGLTRSNNSYYTCGGSIITDKHILTAAHCFCNRSNEIEIPSELYIGIGDHNRSEITDNLADFVEPVLAKNITVHEKWNCSDVFSDDIAVIELSRAIDLVKHAHHIHPICLPKDDTKNYAGLNATVSGWGSTIGYNPLDQDPKGPLSNVLKEAQLIVGICSNFIPETQLCERTMEGFENGGKGHCTGDSGGPLFIKENGQHVQIGIVSFAFNGGCATNESFGVCQRVSKYLSWIEKQVGSEKTYTLS